MQLDNPYKIGLVSSISAGRDAVFFSRSWIEGDNYASSIFRIDSEGVRRITFGATERSPKYHNGVLYYISRDSSIDRIMKLEALSEPAEIFKYKQILEFAPYRDGVLSVVSENFKSTRPFVIHGLRYKHDSTGLLRKRRTLYFTNQEGTRKMVPGSFDVGGVRTNGDSIIVSCAHMGDELGLTDLYSLDFESGEMRKVTRGQGAIEAFDVSPDGEVAYLGHRQGPDDWAIRRIHIPRKKEIYEVGKTAGTFVSTDIFDDSGPALKWDSGDIYAIGQEGGTTPIYRIREKHVERVTPEGLSVRHFDVLDGRISYSYSTVGIPSIISTDYGPYDPNLGYRGREAERITSGKVEGWIILREASAPTILFIHGGPHSAFGNVYTIEMQYFASRGYNILYCNPRGSMGYGEPFVKGSIGDWGGEDARDILDFLHTAIRNYSITGRIGIKGISYGGYMVNWLITQTDQFSAAVSEKGVSNLLSSCGTSDIGYWFDAPEEIGSNDPWSPSSISLFMERSPITHVKKVKTPTLLIHGEDDHRCPIEQSEQFFTALKFYGVDSVFVRLQGESHELSNMEKPLNRMESLTLKRDWFDKYLKGINNVEKQGSTSRKKN